MNITKSVELELSVSDQILFDVFTTALEGGINYWAGVVEYNIWLKDDAGTTSLPHNEDLKGFFAIIIDNEDEDEKLIAIDRELVFEGLVACATKDVKHLGSHAQKVARLLLLSDNEDVDFDASDADQIVQVGLFGEVVYG
jgi:hypothetical protein